MKKLAVLRDINDGCPFGLDIPFACRCAGDLVNNMAPLMLASDEEDMAAIIRSNNEVVLFDSGNNKCRFADKIMEDSVNCTFEELDFSNTDSLAGSPFYSKVYDNVSYDGVFSYPLGYYGDNNISRNSYYGAFSLQGSRKVNYKMASVKNDIRDALDHFKDLIDRKVCFKIAYEGDMSLKEITSWDDYSSWGNWNKGELSELDEPDLFEEISSFRGKDWALRSKHWIKDEFPPIILISSEFGDFVGDGRGRVSLAVGLDLKYLPVIILNEDENGDLCINPN